MAKLIDTIRHYLGIEWSPVSRVEQLVSALGGLLGILAILLVSGPFLHEPAGAVIVASMGASAVLLFAVPHGPLSQPWAVLGGHIVSAFIGVSCARFVPEALLAAALAVGLAIGAMHLLRCIHPPGGATALAAVVSGPEVQSLGYQYMLTPVLLNVCVILAVAVVFNYFFRWRRYPVALTRTTEREAVSGDQPVIEHDRLMQALGQLDTFVDISEQDLLTIYSLVTAPPGENNIGTAGVEPGASYSNGRFGADWQVREVTAVEDAGEGRKLVSYRIVAGDGRNRSGKCGLLEFADWAHYRVERNENSWRRI
jgi:CBS domain-containing membrane protein